MKKAKATASSSSAAKSTKSTKGKLPFSSKIAAPVAEGSKYKGRKPVVTPGKDGKSLVVSHCERIGTIAGSVTFAANSFPLNPGVVTSFPWLSSIANQYESYRFRSLRPVYRAKCATTSTGDVSIGVDYDAADAAPVSTLQMENWDDSVNGSPWMDFEMVCSGRNLAKEKEYYTRATPTGANQDIKTYDVGNLYVCTEGQGGTSTIGYLYAEYVVELMTPQLTFGVSAIGGRINGGGVLSGSNPLGSLAAADTQVVGVSVGASSIITLAFPGTYVVGESVGGTGLSAFTFTAGSGVTASAFSNIVDATAVTQAGYWLVVSTVMNGTLTATMSASTVTSSTVAVAMAPPNSLF